MDKSSRFNPPVGVAELVGPALRRVLAPNPSPMTFRGTNTYLVGTRDIAVIDPGPPDEAHLAAIMGALEGHQRISHIFVTHSHVDHSPLAMVLAQVTNAKVHAFGPSKAGRAPVITGLDALGGGEGVDETFMPDVALPHLAEVMGSDWTLRALHTPGHMGNHLSFELDLEGAFSGHVFCGDLVMGWSTSLVSPPDGHVSDFMASLQMLSERDGHAVYHAGHGAPIEAPAARMAELMAHRRVREGQILEALEDRAMTAAQLAEAIYVDLDPQLLPAAARNVLAHLIDLTTRNAARPEGTLSEQAVFSRQT